MMKKLLAVVLATLMVLSCMVTMLVGIAAADTTAYPTVNGAVDEVKIDTPYYLAGLNANGPIYFDGTVADGRINGATAMGGAVEVKVEAAAAAGEYYIYFMDGATKTYIAAPGSRTTAFALETEKTDAGVWIIDPVAKTIISKKMGTRGIATRTGSTYTNFSTYASSNFGNDDYVTSFLTEVPTEIPFILPNDKGEGEGLSAWGSLAAMEIDGVWGMGRVFTSDVGASRSVHYVNPTDTDISSMKYLEFDLYVSANVLDTVNIHIELGSDGSPDDHELSCGKDGGWKGLTVGWNKIYLNLEKDFKDVFTTKTSPVATEEFDYTSFNRLSIVNNVPMTINGSFTIALANVKFTKDGPEKLNAEEMKPSAHSVPFYGANAAAGGWSVDYNNQLAGAGCITRVFDTNTDFVDRSGFMPAGTVIDATGMDTLEFDIYLSDLGFINFNSGYAYGGQIEISSSGICDNSEITLTWIKLITYLRGNAPKVGWNHVAIPIKELDKTQTAINMANINYFGIYFNGVKPDKAYTIKLDNFRFTDAQAAGAADRAAADAEEMTATPHSVPIFGFNQLSSKPLPTLASQNQWFLSSNAKAGSAGWAIAIQRQGSANEFPSTPPMYDVVFDTPIDISKMDTIEFDIWVDAYNAEQINKSSFGNGIWLTSTGQKENNPKRFYISGDKLLKSQTLVAGWNHIAIPYSDLVVGADVDLTKINFIRIALTTKKGSPDARLSFTIDNLRATDAQAVADAIATFDTDNAALLADLATLSGYIRADIANTISRDDFAALLSGAKAALAALNSYDAEIAAERNLQAKIDAAQAVLDAYDAKVTFWADAAQKDFVDALELLKQFTSYTDIQAAADPDATAANITAALQTVYAALKADATLNEYFTEDYVDANGKSIVSIAQRALDEFNLGPKDQVMANNKPTTDAIDAANAFVGNIDVNNYMDAKAAIEAARKAYEDLPFDVIKTYFQEDGYLTKLEDAEAALAQATIDLSAAYGTDADVADVAGKIDTALTYPVVNETNYADAKAAINGARAAYDALPGAYRYFAEQDGTYKKLLDAEANLYEYERFYNYKQEILKNNAELVDLISSLPLTLDTGNYIRAQLDTAAARKAYDALADKEKKVLVEYGYTAILTSAERAIKLQLPGVEAELDAAEAIGTEHKVPLFGANTVWGAGWAVDKFDKLAGSGSLALTFTSGLSIGQVKFDAIDATGMDTLEFDLYLSDVALLEVMATLGGELEVTSGATCDVEEIAIDVKDLAAKLIEDGAVEGWNHVSVRIADMKTRGGDFDIAAVDFIRLYIFNTENMEGKTIKVDNFCLTDAYKQKVEAAEAGKDAFDAANPDLIAALATLTGVEITADNYEAVKAAVATATELLAALSEDDLFIAEIAGYPAAVDAADAAVLAYEKQTTIDSYKDIYDQIMALPDVINLANFDSAKAAVAAARAAYDALSDEAKAELNAIGTLIKLEATEKAVADYALIAEDEKLNAEEMAATDKKIPIFGFNSNASAGWTIDKENQLSGSGCWTLDMGKPNGLPVAQVKLPEAIDATGMDQMEFDVYIADLEFLKGGIGGGFEITSSGTCDKEELEYLHTTIFGYIKNNNPKVGWNHVVLPLSDARKNGEINLGAINYIRIYMTAPNETPITIKFDNLCLTKAVPPSEDEAEKDKLADEAEMTVSEYKVPVFGFNTRVEGNWALDKENKVAGSASNSIILQKGLNTISGNLIAGQVIDATGMTHVELDVYISDVALLDEDLSGYQLELCSGGNCDKGEMTLEGAKLMSILKAQGAKAGWNHVKVAVTDLPRQSDFNISAINYMRIYTLSNFTNKLSKDYTFKFDNLCLTKMNPDDAEAERTENKVPIFGFNTQVVNGWAVDKEDKVAGSASASITLKPGMQVISGDLLGDKVFDATGMNTLEIEVYISDLALLDHPFPGAQIELCSGDACDKEEATLEWDKLMKYAKEQGAKVGWNHVEIPLDKLSNFNSLNLSKINYMRIYFLEQSVANLGGEYTLKLDNLCLTKTEVAPPVIDPTKTNVSQMEKETALYQIALPNNSTAQKALLPFNNIKVVKVWLDVQSTVGKINLYIGNAPDDKTYGTASVDISTLEGGKQWVTFYFDEAINVEAGKEYVFTFNASDTEGGKVVAYGLAGGSGSWNCDWAHPAYNGWKAEGNALAYQILSKDDPEAVKPATPPAAPTKEEVIAANKDLYDAIKALTTTITAENFDAAKAAYDAAKSAYNKLDDVAKGYFNEDGLDKMLADAKKALDDYEPVTPPPAAPTKDEVIAANKDLYDAIKALTTTITAENFEAAKAAYEAAKTGYDALDETAKGYFNEDGLDQKLADAKTALDNYKPDTQKEPEKGCKSVLSIGATAMMILAGAWVTMAARKKED